MAIRHDKGSIPTLAVGIQRFLKHERAAGKKDVRNVASILLGPERVVGKAAAGPAFAQTEYGKLRMYRLEAHHFTEMFERRLPLDLAPATRKRGMSAMATFLDYSISQGWFDDHVRTAVTTIPDSSPRREWLFPEQSVALTDLIADCERFDDYDEFAYDCSLSLGTRTFETADLTRDNYDPRMERVKIPHGKGRGAGKERYVPADDAFGERWEEHARRNNVKRNGPMLFRRLYRVRGGSTRELDIVVDRTKPTTSKTLRNLFTRIQVVADDTLPLEVAPNFNLTPKVMRRTYACTQLILHRLGKGGLDLFSLKEALGHSSLETTQVYLADVNEYLNLIERPVNALDGAKLIVAYRESAAARD